MKIWIHIDGVQQGPFELDELPAGSLTPETPVWYEGLSYWMPAGKAPATVHLFAQGNPVQVHSYDRVEAASQQYAPNQGQVSSPTKCPRTYIVWSILLTLLCCNPIGIIPILTGVTVTSKFKNYNYEGAKRASEITEWWLMITIVTSLILLPLTMIGAL